MTIVLRLCVAILSAGVGQSVEKGNAEALEHWDRIKSLHEKGDPGSENPDLEQYLKSLTPEEMIIAARQACEKHAPYGIVLCLKHYIENSGDSEEGIRKVLGIVADPGEHRDLRRALIQQMSCSRFNGFVDELQTYADGHVSEVYGILSTILQDRREDLLLRDAAMSTVAEGLREQMIKGCAADPNVRRVKERTHKIVPVGEMVRAGELTLSADTWRELKPIEERILANAKALEAIVVDEENEPDTLRARAKFMLESYERLPLTQQGRNEVEKARGADKD